MLAVDERRPDAHVDRSVDERRRADEADDRAQRTRRCDVLGPEPSMPS